MTAYAMARLRDAAPHADIAEYIERLSATFEPYGGRYLVHVTPHEVVEGDWPGGVVMLGFPGIAEARAWWHSPAYQEIAPLRSRHIESDIILVEGVPENYDPSPAARAIREAAAGDGRATP
ncbi:DUF1330 domain-containing protein [Spongiactinospora sp. TRM90649]|uniref:DUF1330 domain-containing protein n=1 Tax=Spongiactinospora sp. TRM90649 TaxID=3031114 RepID=UPI0023F61ADE|nr:DUF1330 domain-containing protein [Spongiactinospora sp. TRM90649]MDF5754403.1 DUF1330 domain-containing protein [Spongiactinospora sp. TRM90649]